MTYENELDYLGTSLTFILERAKTTLEQIRECKQETETLKIDLTKITTKRLLDTASDTHNHFNGEKVRLTGILKDIREDEKWIRRLISIVQKYYKGDIK